MKHTKLTIVITLVLSLILLFAVSCDGNAGGNANTPSSEGGKGENNPSSPGTETEENPSSETKLPIGTKIIENGKVIVNPDTLPVTNDTIRKIKAALASAPSVNTQDYDNKNLEGEEESLDMLEGEFINCLIDPDPKWNFLKTNTQNIQQGDIKISIQTKQPFGRTKDTCDRELTGYTIGNRHDGEAHYYVRFTKDLDLYKIKAGDIFKVDMFAGGTTEETHFWDTYINDNKI